jgi:hypothetical protein
MRRLYRSEASVFFMLVIVAAGMTDDSWAGWTDRLGLRFSEDCQEHAGIVAFFAWAESWLSGRHGKQRDGHCETKEMRCPEGLAVTGLAVKSGHTKRSGSRELFDFQLRCGSHGALTGWMGMRFDTKASEHGAAVCPAGTALTGLQVMRGRGEGRDMYNFKLRCDREWRSVVGLPFDALKETRSATCRRESTVVGVRVHRGFQDWGSVDTYEFQLKCAEDDDLVADLSDQRPGALHRLNDLLASLGVEEAWELLSSLGLGSSSLVDTSDGFKIAAARNVAGREAAQDEPTASHAPAWASSSTQEEL